MPSIFTLSGPDLGIPVKIDGVETELRYDSHSGNRGHQYLTPGSRASHAFVGRLEQLPKGARLRTNGHTYELMGATRHVVADGYGRVRGIFKDPEKARAKARKVEGTSWYASDFNPETLRAFRTRPTKRKKQAGLAGAGTASGLPRDVVPAEPGRGKVLPRSQSYTTPPKCWVQRVRLGVEGAEVGYACHGSAMTGHPLDEQGREGMFPTPDGSWGTYPSLRLNGVTGIAFRGVKITGDAKAGFVTMPASATCRRDKNSTELSCRLVGDTSSPGLAGARKKKPRR